MNINTFMSKFNNSRVGEDTLSRAEAESLLKQAGIDLNSVDIEALDDFLAQGEETLSYFNNERERLEHEMTARPAAPTKPNRQDTPKSTYSEKQVKPEVVTPRKEEPQSEPKKNGRGKKSDSPITNLLGPKVGVSNTVHIRAINPIEFITIAVCSAALFHMLGSLKAIPLDLRTIMIRFVLIVPAGFSLFWALMPYGHKQRQLFLLAAILTGIAAGYFFLQVQAISS